MQIFIKVFEILLGAKESIRASHLSGRIATLPIALLLVVYLTIVSGTNLVDSSTLNTPLGGVGFAGLIFCFSIVFTLLGGLAVSWSFTRPMASLFEIVLPDAKATMIWGFSSGLVWAILAALITYPEDIDSDFLDWISFFVVILMTFGFGFYGGWRARKNPTRQKREIIVSGSIATGSLIGIMQTVLTVSSSGGLQTHQISDLTLQLISNMAILSFVCSIPFAFIGLIAIVLSAFERLEGYYLLIIVVLSTVCWLLIGGVFLTLDSETELREVIIPIFVVGLSGACGGFVIGQMKPDRLPDKEKPMNVQQMAEL